MDENGHPRFSDVVSLHQNKIVLKSTPKSYYENRKRKPQTE
jgi:hypothetical protein